MTKYDLKPIVKTFYDALEEGTILGRKCLRCGHIEFPPFLCCNACGGLDTLPWNGTVVMLFALSGVSYRKGYWHVAVETVILPLLSLVPAIIYYSIAH